MAKKKTFTISFYKSRTEKDPVRVIKNVTDIKILNKSETLSYTVEGSDEVFNLALGVLDVWFAIE